MGYVPQLHDWWDAHHTRTNCPERGSTMRKRPKRLDAKVDDVQTQRSVMRSSQAGGESSASELPVHASVAPTGSARSAAGSGPVSAIALSSKKHRLHLQQSLQEHASAAPSSFAQSQLQKMGWKAGQGLGRHHTGITTHIRVQKRSDETAGLGVEQMKQERAAAAAQNEWWKDSLGATLAKLSSSGNPKKKKRPAEHRSFTDEELFAATGGARFGMRAAPTQKLGKWKRANDPGTGSSSNKGSDSEATVEVLPALRESSASSSSDEEEPEQAVVAVPTEPSPKKSDKDKKRKRDKKEKKMKKDKKKEKRTKTSQP